MCVVASCSHGRPSRPPYNLLWGPHHRNTIGLFDRRRRPDGESSPFEDRRLWRMRHQGQDTHEKRREDGESIISAETVGGKSSGVLRKASPLRSRGTREVQATLRVPVAAWSLETVHFASALFLLWLMASPVFLAPIFMYHLAFTGIKGRIAPTLRRRGPTKHPGPARVDAIVSLVASSTKGTDVVLGAPTAGAP